MTKVIHVVIIDYPNALQSSVHGLKELLLLSNQIVIDNNLDMKFDVQVVKPNNELENVSQSDVVFDIDSK